MKVVLRTRTVGQHFATCGVILGPSGQVLAEGYVRPYGCTGPALADVVDIAKERGYEVVEPGDMCNMLEVRDLITGELLEGSASEELIAASLAAEPTGGFVLAYCDEHGVWQYVQEPDEDYHRRQLGHDVRTVWVER